MIRLPVHAGNQFLFTKYLITNQNYIDYLNSTFPLLIQEDNLYYNLLSQKILNIDNSRIVFDDNNQIFTIEDEEYLNHPVTGVTWYGATSYANYFGWRLPSTDEWKYIASGDSTDWKYPYLNIQANHSWVDTSQTNCNYNS